MIKIQTASGREIECRGIYKSNMYNVLNIHTQAITPAEAYMIFGNPEETKVLIQLETKEDFMDEPIKTIYRGFTECYMVKKSPLYSEPDCYMIWLNHPLQEEPEEHYTDEEIQEEYLVQIYESAQYV